MQVIRIRSFFKRLCDATHYSASNPFGTSTTKSSTGCLNHARLLERRVGERQREVTAAWTYKHLEVLSEAIFSNHAQRKLLMLLHQLRILEECNFVRVQWSRSSVPARPLVLGFMPGRGSLLGRFVVIFVPGMLPVEGPGHQSISKAFRGKKCRSIRVAPFCARLVAPHICHMKVGGFVATIDHARSCLLLRVEPPSDLPSRKCAKLAKFMLFIDTTSDGLKNMVYFDPYLKKWSNLTNLFSNRLEPPTRNTWVLRLRPFIASIHIFIYIYKPF